LGKSHADCQLERHDLLVMSRKKRGKKQPDPPALGRKGQDDSSIESSLNAASNALTLNGSSSNCVVTGAAAAKWCRA
jgi:hypothetical protein